jgi:hypothetical protein
MEDRIGAYGILVGRHIVKRPLGNVGLEGGIILKLVFKCVMGGMNLIYLARDRDRWHALVIAVMNLWVP